MSNRFAMLHIVFYKQLRSRDSTESYLWLRVNFQLNLRLLILVRPVSNMKKSFQFHFNALISSICLQLVHCNWSFYSIKRVIIFFSKEKLSKYSNATEDKIFCLNYCDFFFLPSCFKIRREGFLWKRQRNWKHGKTFPTIWFYYI